MSTVETAAARQTPDGWFPDCDLSDPERPLLHTIAYTIRGLLEGGRVRGRPDLVESAQRGARRLIAEVRDDGWMPGRFAPGMKRAVPWSCLSGNAQSCNCWLRLHDITGDDSWLEPIPRVLRFLESTQDTGAAERGLRGIHGAWPVDGDYGAYEILNWATKFFADAIMRFDVKRGSSGRSLPPLHRLA